MGIRQPSFSFYYQGRKDKRPWIWINISNTGHNRSAKFEKVCVVYDSIKRGRTTTSETISRGFLNFCCKSDTSPHICCTDRTSNDCFFRQNYDCNNIVVSECSYWITATEAKTVEIEGGLKKMDKIFEVERVKNGNRIQDETRTYVTAD